jgi:hypothetical protein
MQTSIHLAGSQLTRFSILGVFDMPILPMYSIASFQKAVDQFRQQVSAITRPDRVSNGNPAVILLPPIPEHTRNVLGEGYHSIAELAQAATTGEGQIALRSLLPESSPSVGDEIVDFWAKEYCIE